jgi:hypothetical protein
MESSAMSERRPNYGRNWRYEEWLIAVGAAQGDLDKLRAEEREELAALAQDKPEPEPEASGSSWLANLTPAMVARAGRKPAANYAHRAELLHGPSRSTPVDTSGVTDYGTFVERGFRK